MTDQRNEMPDEIWAAMGKDGTAYWIRDRHEAMDGADAMKQTRYVRHDLALEALIAAINARLSRRI